jgi:hypothetical protein
MWSSWVKTKDTTQVMHIAKLKDGPKRAMKLSQKKFGKGFENGMMEGDIMDSRKKILKLNCFSPIKILTSPFYLERLLENFFFLPHFFPILFLSLFNAPLFEDLGILMINEEKNTHQKFLFR